VIVLGIVIVLAVIFGCLTAPSDKEEESNANVDLAALGREIGDIEMQIQQPPRARLLGPRPGVDLERTFTGSTLASSEHTLV
jgi:hypothetical protein